MPLVFKDLPRFWQRAGLDGERIKSLAVDPGNSQVLYAGTSAGTYRHPYCDGAWFNTMLPSEIGVYAIAAAAPPSGHMFVGTGGQGVYRSIDAGVTWGPINSGLDSLYINALAVSPNYAIDQTIYVGTDTHGVYKSTSGGLSWQSANVGLTSTAISSLVIHPANPQIVAAGSFDEGTFRSTNGGGSWTSTPIGNAIVWSLSTGATNPPVFYAGTDGGVYRSADLGASWALNGQLGKVYTVVVDPLDEKHIFAGTSGSGVWVTTNEGANWGELNSGLDGSESRVVQTLAIDPGSCGVLYAGTNDGVWSWRLD